MPMVKPPVSHQGVLRVEVVLVVGSRLRPSHWLGVEILLPMGRMGLQIVVAHAMAVVVVVDWFISFTMDRVIPAVGQPRPLQVRVAQQLVQLPIQQIAPGL